MARQFQSVHNLAGHRLARVQALDLSREMLDLLLLGLDLRGLPPLLRVPLG